MATPLTTADSFMLAAHVWMTGKIVGERITNKSELALSIEETLTFAASGDWGVNQLFSDVRVLAGSANEDLDLYGVLLDPAKNVLNLATFLVLAVHNRSDETLTSPAHTGNDTATIEFKRAALNGVVGLFTGASHGIILKPGESAFFFLGKGRTITNATGDLFNVLETAAAEACYEVAILGVSA